MQGETRGTPVTSESTPHGSSVVYSSSPRLSRRCLFPPSSMFSSPSHLSYPSLHLANILESSSPRIQYFKAEIPELTFPLHHPCPQGQMDTFRAYHRRNTLVHGDLLSIPGTGWI